MSEGKGAFQFFLFNSYKSKKTVAEASNKIINREGGLHNHVLKGNILGDKKSLFFLIKLYRMGFQKKGDS